MLFRTRRGASWLQLFAAMLALLTCSLFLPHNAVARASDGPQLDHLQTRQPLALGERLTPRKDRPFAVRVSPRDDLPGSGGPPPDGVKVCVAAPPRGVKVAPQTADWPNRTPGTLVMLVDGLALREVVSPVSQAWNWAISELRRQGSPASQVVFHAGVDPYRSWLTLTARAGGRFDHSMPVGEVLDQRQWAAAAWLLSAKLVGVALGPTWHPPPHVVEQLAVYRRPG